MATNKTSAKKSVKTAQKKPATKAVKKTVASKTAKKAVTLQKKVAPKAAKKVVAKKQAAAKPLPKKAVANKAVAKAVAASKPQVVAPVAKPAMQLVTQKPVAKAVDKRGFNVGDYVVYPTHGVGRITGIETETIGEYELKVFVIAFEKDKMILRVPVGRAATAGLRGISGSDDINRALSTLKGRAKTARGMWSRRAQEYEAKINSGNIVQIAEVVRDLHKNVDQSERSYSERMIYETAMNRLTGEVAAFDKVDQVAAHEKLIKVLRKQAA